MKAVVNGGVGFHCGYFVCAATEGDSTKTTKIKLNNAMTHSGNDNAYEFYMKTPWGFVNPTVSLKLDGCGEFVGDLRECTFSYLSR